MPPSPVLLAVLHGAATGFDRWWFAVAKYRLSVESVATGSLSHRADLLWEAFVTSWPCIVPLMVLAPIGIVVAIRTQRGALLVIWGALSLTGFALGGLFHPHYFVGLIAPFSALSALGLRWVVDRFGVRVAVAVGRRPARRAGDRGVAGRHGVLALGRVVAHLPRRADPHGQGSGSVAAGRTRPGETVYALYADASLYFAADRPPAFKYLWFLGEQRIPGALGELRDILAGPKAPRYVVVYQPPRSMPGAVAAGIPAVLKARYAAFAKVAGHDVLRLRQP